MNVKEVARKYGVSERQISYWIKSGKLKAQTADDGQRVIDQAEFHVSGGFDVISTYKELLEYTCAFAKGQIGFLLLVGSPGSGKSLQIKSDLCSTKHKWIDNHASNLGLYCAIYEAQNAPIVMDDINHFLKNKMACSLLKSLAQTETRKHVSWESTASQLIQRNTPREYVTTSPICMIANQWRSNDPDMAAIQDRSIPVAFFPSAEEIHHRVIELGWCDKMIIRFVGQHLDKIPEPSMREYYNCMKYKGAGMDYKSKMLKIWGIDNGPSPS